MRRLTRLRVFGRLGDRGAGWLQAGDLRIACALGPAGVRAHKREGDGATPRGRFLLSKLYFRPDSRPPAARAGSAIRHSDGWCDDPASGQYNRPVRLPFAAGHERLWRSDACYDVIVVLEHNQRPRVRGRGSAVFFHIAHDDLRPTAGCVAIRAADMRRLLPRLSRRCVMAIGG